MGIEDRYWGPIEPEQAAAVLGRPVEIVSQHLRWLFAVAHCRWDEGEAIVKRQPPMGRDRGQVLWQHRLVEHLAERDVPAARARGLVEMDGLWYEVFDLAAGRDVYSAVDTWEPFRSEAHVAAAGAMLARLHEGGAGFEPVRPQPQAGFVVQLGLAGLGAVGAVEQMIEARPAVAEYLAGVEWRAAVAAAYDRPLARIAEALPALPTRPLHGDWQTNNLFFEGDEVSGIIDFHQADHGPRVLDLATAVERNCFFWNRISTGEDGAFDLRHAQVLVAAYDRFSPLSATERAAFADVLTCCQFEYGISFLDYYWGIEHDREKADWAWHTFVLGHAQWWQTPPGEAARAEIERIAAAP